MQFYEKFWKMGTEAVIVKFIIGTDWLLRENFQLPRERRKRKKKANQVFMDHLTLNHRTTQIPVPSTFQKKSSLYERAEKPTLRTC